MSTTLGNPVVHPAASTSPPPAQRVRQPGWRDPRLWVGVLLVAASVLAGGRLLGSADRYVEVWTVAGDHAVGDTLTRDDLVASRVRFEVAADADRYVLVGEHLPERPVLLRGLGEGELVPRAGIGSQEESGVLTVPITLPAFAVPPGLRPGSRVDVWVTNDAGGPARRAFEDVVVIGLPRGRDGFGGDGDRQLVLGLTEDRATRLSAALTAIAGGDATVVARG